MKEQVSERAITSDQYLIQANCPHRYRDGLPLKCTAASGRCKLREALSSPNPFCEGSRLSTRACPIVSEVLHQLVTIQLHDDRISVNLVETLMSEIIGQQPISSLKENANLFKK
ncbi:MAG: hypothetical protein Q7S44_01400 [bacterium]|nr:hypothetical protein [bacterium]